MCPSVNKKKVLINRLTCRLLISQNLFLPLFYKVTSQRRLSGNLSITFHFYYCGDVGAESLAGASRCATTGPDIINALRDKFNLQH